MTNKTTVVMFHSATAAVTEQQTGPAASRVFELTSEKMDAKETQTAAANGGSADSVVRVSHTCDSR